MIRRNITYKETSLIVLRYKAIFTPHLEYCIQAWNRYIRKDIDMHAKMQRRATKLIPGLRDLRYEERLEECGLATLERRRLRVINMLIEECGLATLERRRLRVIKMLIEVFNILNGYENSDTNCFSKLRKVK